MDDVVLDVVNSVEFLGIDLDKGLTWNIHIDSLSAKMASGIFALRNPYKLNARLIFRSYPIYFMELYCGEMVRSLTF